MKHIIQNEYFQERTEIHQQTIDLMVDYFPESGYPSKIYLNDEYVFIFSRLCDLSIGYMHKTYKPESNIYYNMTLYNKQNRKPIAEIETKYPCYNVVFYEGKIFMATGVYGDYLAGELLCFSIATKELTKCSDEKRAVHWLVLKGNKLEIYTYKSLGYYESEGQKFHVINPNENLFMDFDKDEYELFEEDDIEEIINEDSAEKRLELLQRLLKS